jgi:hypothetical protein
MKQTYVMITTKHRGVFAGYLLEERDNGSTVVLEQARCAIRWGTSKGFLELASEGPTSNSKIGAVAPQVTLYDVTAKVLCTEKAEGAWRAAA